MAGATSPLLEERDGRVAILTLNAPEKRNALTPDLRLAFLDALKRVEADPEVGAVVLTGAGGHFCAGGDITAMRADGMAKARERFALLHTIVRGIVTSAKPYVAAVEGWAAGAGFSLALCCDTVVASREARFVAAFPKMGLVPDAALMATLPARVGLGVAKQIILYARPVEAARGLEIGMVDELVPAGEVRHRAVELARDFEGLAPLSAAFAKAYWASRLDEVLEWERTVQAALFQTADHREGRAAFAEKRKPRFEGR